MVENIKRMWSKMMDETQRDVLKAISDEFGIVEHYARNQWIYKGIIPKNKQEKVVDICHRALRKQWEETKTLIG